MFKPTAPQYSRIRLRLTTKAVNKGFYKGNRTGSMGAHTQYGSYIVDYRKARTYVCPEPQAFEKFNLTPFVTRRMEPTKFYRTVRGEQVEVKEPDGINGYDFLRILNEENPDDIRDLESYQQSSREETDGTTQAENQDTPPQKKALDTDFEAIDFSRMPYRYDRLSAQQKKLFGFQEKVFIRERLNGWYREIERQTHGKGMGGPSRRKIRA